MGNMDQLKSILLIQTNVVEIRNNDGDTLLMEATRYNKPQMVQILIDAGSDVNAVEKNKINAYHYSACVGHENVLQVLIRHDVTNINKTMMYDWTPLHFASKGGHIQCVKLILAVPQINVNINNNNNETAYDVANNDTVKLLIDGHQKQ
ncbi:poly [ADP-ribose] polymerase tankyrase-2-like [Hydractinia symbiolongicarpus]|uniref:poly [ADP-ribose] polymerase tankyrase-2-like n=1 Tax=Hydractinia symbiolongicarpus TaxID=13093 RepID=UPI00254E33AB|nr:poly [ADP-ribose] polymerase tankyrase-2-like [Hydractinia symbiolongicarpus]